MKLLVLFVFVLTLAITWNGRVCESAKAESGSRKNTIKALSKHSASKWEGKKKDSLSCGVEEKTYIDSHGNPYCPASDFIFPSSMKEMNSCDRTPKSKNMISIVENESMKNVCPISQTKQETKDESICLIDEMSEKNQCPIVRSIMSSTSNENASTNSPQPNEAESKKKDKKLTTALTTTTVVTDDEGFCFNNDDTQKEGVVTLFSQASAQYNKKNKIIPNPPIDISTKQNDKKLNDSQDILCDRQSYHDNQTVESENNETVQQTEKKKLEKANEEQIIKINKVVKRMEKEDLEGSKAPKKVKKMTSVKSIKGKKAKAPKTV